MRLKYRDMSQRPNKEKKKIQDLSPKIVLSLPPYKTRVKENKSAKEEILCHLNHFYYCNMCRLDAIYYQTT